MAFVLVRADGQACRRTRHCLQIDWDYHMRLAKPGALGGDSTLAAHIIALPHFRSDCDKIWQPAAVEDTTVGLKAALKASMSLALLGSLPACSSAIPAGSNR